MHVYKLFMNVLVSYEIVISHIIYDSYLKNISPAFNNRRMK
jgi:hypothetical protein